MPANSNTIQIEIEIDDKGGVKVLRQIGKESEAAGKKGDKGFRTMSRSVGVFNRQINITHGLATKLGAAFGLWKLWQVSEGFHEVTIEAERTQAMLEGLYDSQAKGRAAFAWIMDFDVPHDIDAIQDSFVKLRSVGIDPTTGRLEALIDAIDAFGGTDEVLKRASVAIQQMAGKGVISMEELRQQLGEAIPTAMPIMAEQLGMTVQEMVDIISKGQLDATRGLNAFFAGMEARYGDASERMMKTWGGMTRKMSKEWTAFRVHVMESGPFQVMKERLGDLLKEIDRLKKTGQLDIWAADMADGVLASIDLMMAGFETLTEAVYGFRAVFGILAEKYYANQINKIDYAIEHLKRKIQPGFWSRFYATDTHPEEKAKIIATIDELKKEREEMLMNKQAGQDMAIGNIQKMDQYTQKIQNARTELARLRADMQARRGERSDIDTDLSIPKKTTTGLDQTKEDLKKLNDLERELAAAEEEFERAKIISSGTYEIMEQQLRRGVGDNLQLMVQEAEDHYSVLENLSQRTAEAMEQNFSDYYFDVIRGEFDDLGDYADAMLRSIHRATADVMGQMTKESLFGKEGESGLIQGIGTWLGGLFKSAKGNVFDRGRVQAFGRGTIVDRPIIFPMATGAGLMGEDGPEGVLPLTRTSSGDLGVKTVGARGGDLNIEVNVINNGEPVEQSQPADIRFDGQKYIAEVHIDKMINSRAYRQANRQAIRGR